MPSVGESLRSIFTGLAPAQGPAVLIAAPWANQHPAAQAAAPAGRVQPDPPPYHPAKSIVLEIYGILGAGEFYMENNGIRVNLPAECVARIQAGDKLIQLDVPRVGSNYSILPRRWDTDY
jgi:hypothetical protein